jgi:2-hydroxychromene-2-carboxylate isomerase
MRQIDWCFDFISPYSYLALRDVERLSGLEVRYRPILFAALLNHWGHKGPAEMPTKRAWTYRSCIWYAAQHAIAFRMPAAHPFNSLPYLRLAIAAGCRPDAVRRIFDQLWTTGVDASDPRIIEDLARSMQVPPDALAAPDVKDALRTQTQQAIDQGVFGVPTLLIDGEIFWGADAIDFAKAFLADPTLLRSDEMRRAAALPVGAARRQSA